MGAKFPQQPPEEPPLKIVGGDFQPSPPPPPKQFNGARLDPLTSHFGIGDRVRIKEIESNAIVLSILLDSSGITYKVSWWMNGDRKEGWLLSHELEGQ